jgi:16S rRNA (guanine527-N7)-methyltransferase
MYFEKRKSVFLELGFNEAALPELRQYIDLLWKTNTEFNLVSRKMTLEELLDNHIIDCMLPLKFFPKNVKTVADLGSGGGLPGLIYALQFPNIKFELYEKSKLKQSFLEQCQKMAPNIRISGEIPLDLKHIDLISARGFKPIDEIIQFTKKYYERKGRYFLMKARKEKIEEEVLLTQKKQKDFTCHIQPLKSPVLDVERHVVLI